MLYLDQFNCITLGYHRSAVVEHAHQRIEQLCLTFDICASWILANWPRRAIALAEFIEKLKSPMLKHIGPVAAAKERNAKRIFRTRHMPGQHKFIGIHFNAINRLIFRQQAHLIVEIKRGSTTRQIDNPGRQ